MSVIKASEIFIKKDDQLIVSSKVQQVDFLLPQSYFNSEIAYFMADQIFCLGIFPIRYKVMDKWHYSQLSLPLVVKLNIYSDLVSTKFKLDGEVQDFKVCSIPSGSVAIDSTVHIQSLDNVKMFMDIFNTAKINSSISYTDITPTYKEAFSKNGIGLGVPSVLLEALISEMCRTKKDENTPFRHVAGKTGDVKDYQFIGLKRIAETSSVLAAISFENMNKSIRTSIKQTREGVEQRKSPLEKMLKY